MCLTIRIFSSLFTAPVSSRSLLSLSVVCKALNNQINGNNDLPFLGTYVILREPDTSMRWSLCFLFVCLRLNGLGHGEWALPGGHLELGEEWAGCASRELLEETGIQLSPLSFSFAHAVNTIWRDRDGQACSAHYVTIFMVATVPSGIHAKLMEPHKCQGWFWHDFDSLPQPLFAPLERLLDSGWKIPSSN